MDDVSQTKVAEVRRGVRQGLPALLLSFGVLVAAVVGLAVRPATAESLVYTYALEPGQTRTYAMSTRMLFTPQDIPDFTETLDETVTGKLTMKVLEVRSDGSTLIDFSMSEVSTTGTDTSDGDVDAGSMRMLVSKSGELLDIEGSGDLFGGFDLGEFMGVSDDGSSVGATNVLPTYPSKPIGPGDTWTESADVPLPFGNESMHMTATGEHQGFQETNYGRAARMHMKMSTPLNLGFSFADLLSGTGEQLPDLAGSGFEAARMVMNGSLRGDATSLVTPGTGDLVKMQMDMKMNFSMRMENVPAELMQGAPTNFSMLGDMRMKLDRIA